MKNTKEKLYVDVTDFYYKVPKRFYGKLRGMGYNRNLKVTTFNTIFKWFSENYHFALSVTERTKDIEEEKIFGGGGTFIKPRGFSLSVDFPNMHLATGYGNKSLYGLCCYILKEAIFRCNIENHKKISYYFYEVERPQYTNRTLIRIKEHKSVDGHIYVIDTLYHGLTIKQILSGKGIVIFDTDQKKDRYFILFKYEINYSFDYNNFSSDFVLLDDKNQNKIMGRLLVF